MARAAAERYLGGGLLELSRSERFVPAGPGSGVLHNRRAAVWVRGRGAWAILQPVPVPVPWVAVPDVRELGGRDGRGGGPVVAGGGGGLAGGLCRYGVF
ncbi:hypothetical protein GCM10010195_72830 [Kitasatospora griseola]|nr:hypothetical protein GCM10010195_72830 [Kitasatospora griseola]